MSTLLQEPNRYILYLDTIVKVELYIYGRNPIRIGQVITKVA